MLQKIKKTRALSSIFNEFADRKELVYFGSINRTDDIRVYKGITFSPDCNDSNYCHGTVSGYDTSVFTRVSTHSTIDESASYEWTVVAVHLKSSGFPHLILDSQKNDKHFYKSVFNKFPKLRRGAEILSHINASAARYFELFINPDSAISALNMLDDTILQRMYSNYGKFDLEVDNDTMYIFKRGTPSSARELGEMLEESLWLAETMEYKNAYATEAIGA